jgi:hypothetical protein
VLTLTARTGSWVGTGLEQADNNKAAASMALAGINIRFGMVVAVNGRNTKVASESAATTSTTDRLVSNLG